MKKKKKKKLITKLVLRQLMLTGAIFIVLIGLLYLRKELGYFDYPLLTGISEIAGITLAFVLGGIINAYLHIKQRNK